MFLGGNKNISRKLGALILAFVFVIGLFQNFNVVNAQGGVAPGGGYNWTNIPTAAEVREEERNNKAPNFLNEYQYTSKKLEQIKSEAGRCFPNGTKNPKSTTEPNCDKTGQWYIDTMKELQDRKNAAQDSLGKLGLGNDGKVINDNTCETTFGIGNPFCEARQFIASYIEVATNTILEFVGLLARFGGFALDKTIEYTIIGLSSFIKGEESESIKIAWEVIRDLINILFIFGLLYISISTIVKGIGPKTKNLLVSLIASALLINFSFFFTSVAIDASNFLAIELYGTIKDLNGCEEGIGACIVGKTRITTALNPTADGIAKDLVEKDGYSILGRGGANFSVEGDGIIEVAINSLVGVIFGSIFILISTFVLLTIAIMLLIRFIMIVFVLITSPVMFLGWVLPNLSSISSRWFRALNEQLFFPPLVFLFIFISLSISEGIGSLVSGTFGFIINYLLIIGFMIGSIIIARQVGATGANRATAAAGGLMLGTAARVSRNTVGRWADRRAQNIRGNNFTNRVARTALQNIGNSSFDTRNTRSFQGIATATGINAGTGVNTGYTQAREAREQRYRQEYEREGDQTREEAEQIDQAREEMVNLFAAERDNIVNAGRELRRLQTEIREHRKGTPEHDRISQEIADQNRIINTNRNTIQNDTRGGYTDENDQPISIARRIRNIQEQPRNRQREFLDDFESRWFLSQEARDAATNTSRRIREERRRTEDEDINNIISSLPNI